MDLFLILWEMGLAVLFLFREVGEFLAFATDKEVYPKIPGLVCFSFVAPFPYVAQLKDIGGGVPLTTEKTWKTNGLRSNFEVPLSRFFLFLFTHDQNSM